MSRRRARVLALSLATAVVLSTAAGIASAAPGEEPDGGSGAGVTEYVALGDSAPAGPLLPRVDRTSPGCLRSDLNYPTLIAEQLGLSEGEEFRDVSCSVANTTHFGNSQRTFAGRVPPQYDALTPTTDLVTVQAGANDIGLVSTLLACVNLGREPFGFSCRDRFVRDGTDRVSDEIQEFAPAIGEVAREIRERSPEADVYFVGYGSYLRPGGCHPRQPVWADDADYISEKVQELNDATRDQAVANGALFIDQIGPSEGRDSCAPPRERWFEGLIVGNVTAPFHPTLLGMRGTTGLVIDAVNAR